MSLERRYFSMHVYFVRHGETDLNVRHLHQSPSTPLNLRGFDQARSAGEYLRPMNATLLVSSSYERAAQTARTIGSSVGLTPTFNRLFCEVERPSIFAETSLFSVRTVWYIGLSAIFRNKSKWRYKDGENFSDMYTRVQKSFHYIESLTEAHESIIIVSHSAYISLLMMYMCHGSRLTLKELIVSLLSINQLKNCDVTHVEYVGPTARGTCAWLLRK
jgi:broad specificity phosphatase PhoE